MKTLGPTDEAWWRSMAQRSEKQKTNNDHETIAAVEPDEMIVHRRTTDKPDRFVPKLAVKPGISVIDLLRRDDDEVSGRGVGK